ncbi:MAG: hypothetical protein CMH56_13255 [Myxococcales bacterium]|nr:hypothetical protein [Myxococcales bacterium]
MASPGGDIAVIGGGVAGLAVAYHLGLQGIRATVFEQEASFDIHSSGRNASIFRHIEGDPLIADLARRSQFYLSQLCEEESQWLKRTGATYVAADKEAVDELSRMADWVDEPCALVGASELREAGFTEEVQFGLHVPNDGILDSHAILTSLRAQARSLGATIRNNVMVNKIDRMPSGQFRLELSTDEKLDVAQVVICSGAWAGLHGAALSIDLDLAPLRRHLVILDVPKGAAPNGVFWRVDDQPCYFRPESGKVLFSPCDETLWPPEAPQKDPEALNLVVDAIQKTFPGFQEAQVVRYWSGLRTFAPDRKPILGPDERVPGLHWCAGLGGHGMTIGCGAGEAVVSGILGKTNDILRSYSPHRFDKRQANAAHASV